MPQDPNCAKKPLNILIIENDPAMARLTKEAFKQVGLVDGVHSASDGDKGLAYLREEAEQHERPDLVFLDLHLPKQSGLEVLEHIKSDPKLSVTPVVIVSGSENPQEVREAYRLHASCYIRKPNDLEQFLQFVRTCYEFWGSVVTLPPKSTSNAL